MNSIKDLLNAVKGSKIKVSITMNNAITYRCYVVDSDNDKFYVSRKYKEEKCNVIDINYVGRVVIRATN